eukprot:TRINITY_DN10949_c0_g2_i1.p1 TRINITY_DN10949_c0_g2~~TRINITY_DN10949_c0_g2_i1.p1  ORF type:complete len:132 (-),score=17.02 TRINITY_DN10949_c0_g2_i1:27-398(-)
MIRRPPRSTLDRSSAASDVYKRQFFNSSLRSSFSSFRFFCDSISIAFDDSSLCLLVLLTSQTYSIKSLSCSLRCSDIISCNFLFSLHKFFSFSSYNEASFLSLIHICRCRRYAVCRSRWSPYH